MSYAKDIYLYEKRVDGTAGVYRPQPDGSFVAEPYEYGVVPPPPTFTLDTDVLQKLCTLFMEETKFKPRNVSEIEGKYSAQSKHLEDLRHLLKLPQ